MMTEARLQNRSDDAYWAREVFPHSSLIQLADDLWVVKGQFPKAKLPRNMVVYRYNSDSLLLHSVVALDEPTMSQLEALGKPSVMVIPCWDHWAHVRAFKRRYPDIDVVCPQASIQRISDKIKVEYSCEEYFPRHGVSFHIPPGIYPFEGVLEVPLAHNKVAFIMNDLITNVPHQPGFYGLLLRMTLSTGKPRVIPFIKRMLKVQREPLRDYMLALAQRKDIEIITTSHGESLVTNIPDILRDVAQHI
jgi:hypothetical protein